MCRPLSGELFATLLALYVRPILCRGVFLPLPPPLLLLVMAMVEICCASVTIIFCSAAILLEVMALDPLIVALAWVSSEKAFQSLAVAAISSANDSSVSVWYAGAGVWVLPLYIWFTTAL